MSSPNICLYIYIYCQCCAGLCFWVHSLSEKFKNSGFDVFYDLQNSKSQKLVVLLPPLTTTVYYIFHHINKC